MQIPCHGKHTLGKLLKLSMTFDKSITDITSKKKLLKIVLDKKVESITSERLANEPIWQEF